MTRYVALCADRYGRDSVQTGGAGFPLRARVPSPSWQIRSRARSMRICFALVLMGYVSRYRSGAQASGRATAPAPRTSSRAGSHEQQPGDDARCATCSRCPTTSPRSECVARHARGSGRLRSRPGVRRPAGDTETSGREGGAPWGERSSPPRHACAGPMPHPADLRERGPQRRGGGGGQAPPRRARGVRARVRGFVLIRFGGAGAEAAPSPPPARAAVTPRGMRSQRGSGGAPATSLEAPATTRE